MFTKSSRSSRFQITRFFSVSLVLALVLGHLMANEHASVRAPAAPFATPPTVKIDVPDEVLIGEDFSFKVTLISGGTVGYGPFMDLILPAGGIDYNDSGGLCDGITFSSAQMIGVNGGPLPLTTYPLTAPCSHNVNNPVCATLIPHPYAANGVSQILVPEAAQLVTIELPFGSFQANQPPVVVQVTAHVSNLADVGMQLNIYARGASASAEMTRLTIRSPTRPS